MNLEERKLFESDCSKQSKTKTTRLLPWNQCIVVVVDVVVVVDLFSSSS
jgi:hypothetical protein